MISKDVITEVVLFPPAQTLRGGEAPGEARFEHNWVFANHNVSRSRINKVCSSSISFWLRQDQGT